MTSFFEHQDRAQSRTGWLVFLFLFGVVGVTSSVALLAIFFVPDSVPLAILFSLLMIGIPFIYKLLTISSSGSLVAESLGGVRIDPASRETHERKILNVVEEMAIASGMPIPPIFVLDEECINAFAAGKTPQDAVIGISRGAIESLNRDELQGVIAHEFSHIFHGDMRINMRAIAAIFGIMAIGYVGYFLLRSTLYAPRGRRSDGRATAALALFGIGLIAIGCIGTFFGRLMQAAISRQREFLADASAVQYTRNPSGIGNALRKIGSQSSSAMRHAQASQLNHMFFSEGVRTLFASHPPIAERVKRIESIAGGYLPDPVPLVTATKEGVQPPRDLAASVDSVGSIPNASLLRIHEEISSFDDSLLTAVHDPDGAWAVVFAATLSPDSSIARPQRELVISRFPAIGRLLERIERLVVPLNVQQRLALVDIACSTLALGSSDTYQSLRQTLADSVRIDGSVNLIEWTVVQILRMRVEVPIAARAGVVALARTDNISSVAIHAQRTLGVLALLGTDDEQKADRAFQAALSIVGLPTTILPARSACTLDSVAVDLDRLEALRPSAAGKVVRGALTCVTADGLTTDREYLLLRALSERLSIPLPPSL